MTEIRTAPYKGRGIFSIYPSKVWSKWITFKRSHRSSDREPPNGVCEICGVDSLLEAPPYVVLVFASLVAASVKIKPALAVEGVHGNESRT